MKDVPLLFLFVQNVVGLAKMMFAGRITNYTKKDAYKGNMRQSWRQSEKADEKNFGTKRQRGSGNSDFYPTDSVSESKAVETKQTDKKNYSLSLKTWQKLVNETALLNDKDNGNRVPMLSIHLRGRHLVVLDFEDFKILEEKAWRYEDLRNS